MKTQIKPKAFVRTPRYWLGINIQTLRRKAGRTQEELANLAGMSARRLRDIENVVPGNNPELGTIEAIAKALKVPMPSLFNVRPDRDTIEI